MRTLKELFLEVKKLLLAEQNEIVSAAGILILISLATKFVGMFFLTLVAREFGTSTETDMYYLASILPETITNIILLGVISSSVIPIFTKVKEREGEAKFMSSFSSTLNASILLFAVLAIIAAIFSRQLIPLALQIAQKTNTYSEEQLNQIVWMMRIMLLPQVILAISAFLTTWLNIYKRFVIPQLAPLIFNLGKIIGVVFLVPLMGENKIWGLVWGSLIGSLLHLLIQLPLLWHLKYKVQFWLLDLKDSNLRKVFKLGFPRVVSLSMEQVAVIVDSILALSLAAGSLTAYQLAVRLISVPMGLFGVNFAIASFPSFAKLYASDDHQGFSKLFYKTLNQIIFLSAPMAVVFIVMRVPIVRLVYGIFGGNFTWNDTILVAWIVLFFSLGLIFEGLRMAMFRVYFAIHNTLIPLISSVFVVVSGIVTGVLLSNYFSHFDIPTFKMISEFNADLFFSRGTGSAGAAGLALSSSITFTIEFFFLLFVLAKKKVIFNLHIFLKDLFFKLLAAAIMMVVCYFMAKLWEEVLNTTKTFQLIFLSGTTILSATMVYMWSSYLFKVEEVDLFFNMIINSFKRIKQRFSK